MPQMKELYNRQVSKGKKNFQKNVSTNKKLVGKISNFPFQSKKTGVSIKNFFIKFEHILSFFFEFIHFHTEWKVSVFWVFLFGISRIRTKYGDLLCKSSYSVRIRENTDQKNYDYGHFLRSVGNNVHHLSITFTFVKFLMENFSFWGVSALESNSL